MLRIAAALAALALSLTPAAAGPVILTVSGAVSNPDRGATDPEVDRLFDYNDVSFDAARRFDSDALAALPAVTVRAAYPKGGPVRAYEGPLLADVLKAAGATGQTVTMRALDGYTMEAPLAELNANGAVLALKRDGAYLAIGDFGPAHIVFPRAERADLAEMSDDLWVWALYHIHVE